MLHDNHLLVTASQKGDCIDQSLVALTARAALAVILCSLCSNVSVCHTCVIRYVLHKEPLINKVYVGNNPKIVPADIQNVPFVAISKIVEVGKAVRISSGVEKSVSLITRYNA